MLDAHQDAPPTQSSPEIGTARVLPYAGSTDHAIDRLRRLDLLLRREVLRHRRSLPAVTGDPAPDWVRYTAALDDEVDALLLRLPPAVAAPDAAQREDRRLEVEIAQLAVHQAARVEASAASAVVLPLVELTRALGLSLLEAEILVIAAACDLDRRYERIYGYLQDDMNRRRPSIGLALSLGCATAEERLAAQALFLPASRLVRHRLVEILDAADEGRPFPSRAIKLDDRIVAHLTGSQDFDARVRDLITWSTPEHGGPYRGVSHLETLERLLSLLSAGAQRAPCVVYLQGPGDADKPVFVRDLCRQLGRALLLVDAEELDTSPAGFSDGLALVLREAVLAGSAICIDKIDGLLEQDAGRARLRALRRSLDLHPHRVSTVFLSGETPWRWAPGAESWRLLSAELFRPGHADHLSIWTRALSGQIDVPERHVLELASLYPFSLARAAAAVAAARSRAELRGDGPATLSDLATGCRQQSHVNLGRLAQQVEVHHRREDLVLPERQMQQLAEVCTQARFRCQVMGAWGFEAKLPLGKGLSALFAGPSGTGKTMSAGVIAHELGLDLYRIDLSQIVSKYIGETEKNLRQIFQSAREANAILFFDEADALLGKRSSVKDAHDRYANIEVAYLLQQMEEYDGITILATNLRQNIDEAFTRRIRFIIDFPFPDKEDRLRIWRRIFPEGVPLASGIDLAGVATRFRMSGGNIRNVALTAAFLAAASGRPVEITHLTQAAHWEMQKMGRLVHEQERASS